MQKDELLTKIFQLRQRLDGEVTLAYQEKGFAYGEERFKAWEKAAYKFLDSHAPSAGKRLRAKLNPMVMSSLYGEDFFERFCRTKLVECQAVLDSLYQDFQNDDYDEEIENIAIVPGNSPLKPKALSNKVFIVHGHDDALKNEVALFLKTLGFEPVILHKQASGGMTIIEKIEEYTDVGFGIVIYTPDDVGSSTSDAAAGKFQKRARQNVVFEHGYLIAKLSRKHVVPLVKNVEEMPGDVSGIVYVTDNGWKHDIAKEMQYAGYLIESEKLLLA